MEVKGMDMPMDMVTVTVTVTDMDMGIISSTTLWEVDTINNIRPRIHR
jgi:hypothetical protein